MSPQVFVITGPSGVGKGTLIRLLRERIPALELVVGEEVVVDLVPLARPRSARGGGDGQLQLPHALEQRANQRALAHAGRAGDDEDLGQAARDASGAAC